MAMSAVSTTELADAIADSPNDGIAIDSSDDAASPDDDQSDKLKDDSAPASEDADSNDKKTDDDSSKVSDDSSDKKSDDSSSKASDDSSDDAKDFEDCKLSISKTGDKKVEVGDTVTWNITVKNSLNTAENVVVEEKLPKNFELLSANASKGSFNNETTYWEIGSLKKSESASLTIKMKAKKAGNFTNQAELFTDSNNLNKNTTVKADVEVVSKDKKAVAKKNNEKKEKIVQKTKKIKDSVKKNATKANNTNQTKKANMKNSGNPIMVLIIAACVVLGLSVLKKKE